MKDRFFCLIYILTGLGLIFMAFQNNEKTLGKLILSVVLFFFILGVKEHFNELKI